MHQTIMETSLVNWLDATARFFLESIIQFIMFNKPRAAAIMGALLAMLLVPSIGSGLMWVFGSIGNGVLTFFAAVGFLVVGFLELIGVIIGLIGSALLITVTWILTFVIYPVGFALIVLTFPLTALVVTGVFTCPTENSFTPWLESVMSQFSEAPHSLQPISFWSGTRDRFISLVSRNLVIKSMKVRFFHLGFCRVAFCNTNVSPVPPKDEAIYVGIFNTWFPLK